MSSTVRGTVSRNASAIAAAPGTWCAVGIKMAAMNMSGRFSVQAAKSYGEKLMSSLLTHQQVDLIFGQQAATKMDLPENYSYAGETNTFIAYDSTRFSVDTTDKDYKRRLRDKEAHGLIPRRYIRDTNYTVCRVHLVESPSTQLILVSWLTDDTGNPMKDQTTFKRVMSFAASLSRDERVPVVVGGSFRVTAEYAWRVAPESFSVYGRDIDSKKELSVFVCSDALQLDAAPGVTCPAKLCVEDDLWVRTHDVFYWHPLFASLNVHIPVSVSRKDGHRNGTMMKGVDYADGGRGDEGKERNGNLKNGHVGARHHTPQTNAGFSPDELYDESLVENASTCYMS